MQWLLTAHVRRYHRHYHGSGHVWQGRFKAFPIQADDHYLQVLRYIERNPLRAELVKRAQDWPWSSISTEARENPGVLISEGPVAKPSGWAARVNRAESEAELQRLRQSVNRGTPYGSEAWNSATSVALGLESSLRPRGRPHKT